jgi:hypothetical protein
VLYGEPLPDDDDFHTFWYVNRSSIDPTPEPIPISLYYGEMKILYRCGEPHINSSQIKPRFIIVNTGNETISLDDLTVHYLYTKTGVMQEVFYVDDAPMGSGNITGTFYEGYMEIGFTPGAGGLDPAGGKTAEIQLRIYQFDHSGYDQSDDYSFDGSKDTYEEWDHMLLFLNGELVWGVPPGGIGPESTPGPTPESTAIVTLEPAIPDTAPTDSVSSQMNGDVDSNYKINIVDAMFIAQYYVGMEPEKFDVTAANVNSDNKINIIDALLVAQYYVGIITGFD